MVVNKVLKNTPKTPFPYFGLSKTYCTYADTVPSHPLPYTGALFRYSYDLCTASDILPKFLPRNETIILLSLFLYVLAKLFLD